MTKLVKIQVAPGVYFVEAAEVNVFILCGCPADSVKHLMKRGLIVTREENGVTFETGPNVVLLSDVLVQNGGFANLAEFPVLQMLYKQGMILPNHPNNTGVKPMLIGLEEQVKAQMEYIYRGNYGLVSDKEIIHTGIDPKAAREMMRLKLKFAFGRISPPEDLLDTRIVGTDPVEIRNGVFVRRLSLNVFEFWYQNESITVDLNLETDKFYGSAYPLGFHNIKREYFAVIHSGEGDGWNVNHPCMSSILMFQGKIYLIDAGPNVLYSLTALGIGVNEIEGIFHTHAHDDHFAGFTTLMRSDHRIKYYATPLVRASVTCKLSALMSIEEKDLLEYFDIKDLKFDVWNDIDGLEVMPVFSPHPVETSILFFRTLWEDGYPSYAHLADIVALDVLEGMITDDMSRNGISRAYFEQVKKEYMLPVDIKKIDVGGGLIHGNANDFKEDTSKKIILSHTSTDLSPKQKEIGSGAPFGMVDVLIPTSQNYLHACALKFLKSYFPSAPLWQLDILLNNRIDTFNPESILIRRGTVNKEIYLVLTGNVELIQSDLGVHNILSAGALIGEISGLDEIPSMGTYRATNFVKTLRIPASLYIEFVKRNNLYDEIKLLQNNREFLQNTWLFGEVVSYPTQNKLAKKMQLNTYPERHVFQREIFPAIFMVKKGKMEKFIGDDVVETLTEGNFFGEECVLFRTASLFHIRAAEEAELYRIPGDTVLDIPVVRWKLFETFQKRKKQILKQAVENVPPFSWKDEYNLNIKQMDTQHRMIFESANMLYEAINRKMDRAETEKRLDHLIQTLRLHFAAEEDLMKRHDYPELENHRKKHELVLNDLIDMRRKFREGYIVLTPSLLEFFKGWSLIEIQTEDRKYSHFLIEKGLDIKDR